MLGAVFAFESATRARWIHTRGAVSYTHLRSRGLNPRKRAELGGSSAVGEGGIPGVAVKCADIGKNTDGEGLSLIHISSERPLKTPSPKAARKAKTRNRLVPVSYTHLDVYKRQELYKRFRPGEPPTIDSARTLLDGLFFNPQRYDLAKVGRYKANKKLGFDRCV